MALKKITGKDIKEAVDWLWEHKQDGGCVHQVLGTTDDGTKLCFVVGWANGRDYGDDDKKYGYFDEGYCISAKIGYQHRNNAMQTDYDWDFNMPYDLETGDVWDTSSYVPRDADWEREAADYNKEAQKIWDAYCTPNEDGTAPIDLMESKKKKAKKLEYIEDAEKRLDMETKVATDFINKLAGTYDGDVSFEFFDAIDGEEEENFAGDEETPIDVICFVADNFGGIGDLYVNVDMIDGEVDGIFVHGESFEGNEWADGYTISNFRGDPGFFNVILHGLLGDEDSADESRSKKKEAKKRSCSMQKKKESVSKKNEGTSSGWDVDFFDRYAGRYLGTKPLTFALNDAQDLFRELQHSARGVSTGAKTWEELGRWIDEHIVKPFEEISQFMVDEGSDMEEDD